jgi:hypothetical protein
MTRITYSGPSGPDADYELAITGHTNHEACAALSALWYAFTTGIERLATLHPEDVKIFEPLEPTTPDFFEGYHWTPEEIERINSQIKPLSPDDYE